MDPARVVSQSWFDARAAAASFAPLEAAAVPLVASEGLVLAAEVRAAADLPGFDTSAMDGWAVCGDPPWDVIGARLAGATSPSGRALAGEPLRPGQALVIATGARVPSGADAVLRSEVGRLVDGQLGTAQVPPAGWDIRRRGSECVEGDVIAEPGMVVTPAVLGLVAAAGADTVVVVRRPVVQVLVLGDELVTRGTPAGGSVRDALGPMVPAWLRGSGAEVLPLRYVPDTADALRRELDELAGADLVVTTGSTARGPVDHLHAVLDDAKAELLVDGVDVRPGHPMLLARLVGGVPLVGLPGNPLAAVAGLLTLALPALRALRGLEPAELGSVLLTEAVVGHPRDTRLVPLRAGAPVRHVGPAMLRGLVHADAMAVIAAGGAPSGAVVPTLSLPR